MEINDQVMKTKINIRKILSEGKNKNKQKSGSFDSALKGLGIKIHQNS
jgi:hypothetical protein